MEAASAEQNAHERIALHSTLIIGPQNPRMGWVRQRMARILRWAGRAVKLSGLASSCVKCWRFLRSRSI